MMEDEEKKLLEELQENLYAQVFHDSNVDIDASPIATNMISPSIPMNQSNSRYWGSNEPVKTFKKFTNKNFNDKRGKFQKPFNKRNNNKVEDEIKEMASPKSFIPYASVLSFMESNEPEEEEQQQEVVKDSPEKKKRPKEKREESDRVLHKQQMKEKYALKAKKAEKVRLKFAKKQLQEKAVKVEGGGGKGLTSIRIETSSEDEVVLIPSKAPLVINLDSSSDDDEIRKLKRPASPSTCSMISDDFIFNADKPPRFNVPHVSADQQANINERLLEVLNGKEKLKKIQNLTKLSSSSSSSARSSCERNLKKGEKHREKGKSKRKSKSIDNLDEENDTIYASKAKISKKTLPIEAIDEGEKEVKKDKNRRRKRSESKKLSENNDSNASEIDVDPKLEMIAKSRKKKKSKSDDKVKPDEVEPEIVTKNDDYDPPIQLKSPEQDCVIVETSAAVPIYEITDDEDIQNDSSDDSMKNFKTKIDCDLSLNVTQVPDEPHQFAPVVEEQKKCQTEAIDCEVGWNDEMKYFYNECKYGRDFTLSSVQGAMPVNYKFWQINHADRVRMNYDHDRKVRCRNCNELGHIAVNCKRPKKRIVCYMCGDDGHRETRCPNSVCLRCGKPNKIFATTCSSCYSSSKKVCPLCHYRGHDIEQCPDKWRRYHSTTSPEQEILEIAFKRNERVYCSICARSGHFAEQCSSFNRTVNGLITSSPINIVSNKSSYTKHYSFNSSKESHQVLQLLTYLPTYKFNFNLPNNCLLYPRFKEFFLNHQQKYKEKLEQLLSPSTSSKSKRKSSKKNNELAHPRNQFHDDNSNYSFSEFFDASKSQENLNFSFGSDAAVDYISFKDNNSSNNNNNNMIEEIQQKEEEISDAKIMLTKEHTSVLMSPKAQNFLFDLGERHKVISRFQWDSTGNSLIIQGLSANQRFFHTEIRSFLYQFGIEEYRSRLEKSTQAPRIRTQVINYLQSNLNLIRKVSIKETRKTLEHFMGAEKEMDHRKAIKYRKNLNIIFMGYWQLLEGGVHVNALRKILLELKKEIELGSGENSIDQKLREEINSHIKYVFSAVDHGNYHQMFEEFQRQRPNTNKPAPNQLVRR